LRALFRRPIDDLLAAMETLVADGNPYLGMLLLLVGLSLSWFAYVPIHELLHALGCVGAGGSVNVLEIQRQYGGALLAEVFPFVVPGGEYAGRLSGFDTHGSDLVYLATVALPYAPSVFPGVLLLRLCARRRRPLLLGLASVLGLAPFYNIPGDYFEMGSILATRAAGVMTGSLSAVHTELRSDDLFLLLGRFFSQPSELGLVHTAQLAVGGALIAISLGLAVLLAFATYALGSLIAAPLAGAHRREREE